MSMRFPIPFVGPTAEIETLLITTATERSDPFGLGMAEQHRRATSFSWGWD